MRLQKRPHRFWVTPFCRCMGIETHSHVRRFLLGNDLNKCIGKTKLGIGIAAGAGQSRVAYQRIVGPKHQGKRIE